MADDGGSDITLILDHNLGNALEWTSTAYSVSTGPDIALQELLRVTSSWTRVNPLNYLYDISTTTNTYGKLECTDGICVNANGTVLAGTAANPLRARLIEGDEVAGLANAIGSDTNDIYNWKKDGDFWDTGGITGIKFSSLSYFEDKNGNGNNDLKWLIANTQENSDYGGTANVYGADINGYWTVSVLQDQKTPWFISPWGDLDIAITDNIGVRPVVTVSKSLITVQE